jgi:hypothetical protein
MAMGRHPAANAAMSAIRSRTGRVEAGARTPEPARVGLTHYSPAGSRLCHVMGASASGNDPSLSEAASCLRGEEVGSGCDTNQISS